MTKLTRPPKPKILRENEAQWRRTIVRLKAKYGNYSAIPRNEKTRALRPISNRDLILAVTSVSRGKCSYCESVIPATSSVTIDHFVPKSIHPNVAFSWRNLLPCCQFCNSKKGNHDTIQFPIINPCKDDPDSYLSYKDGDPVPAPDCIDLAKAMRTIDLLDLRRKGLSLSRFRIYESLMNYKCDLHEALQKFTKAPSKTKRQRILEVITQTLEIVERLSESDRPHSQFVSHFIRNNDVIQKAKELIEN